jgi:putative tRNA adenosine deaminase-associated protein
VRPPVVPALVNRPVLRLAYAGVAGQRAERGPGSTGADQGAADTPYGFAVAVVRENAAWRCAPMSAKALVSLTAAETELRELRSAGAVFGLLDIDDEFFVIVRPAPSGAKLLLSDATAALDYDIAAETLEKLDADIATEDLEDSDPFEEGDLGVLADLGLPDAVLSVILSETDLYADEQIGRIAREMGFAEELSAVLDRLDR